MRTIGPIGALLAVSLSAGVATAQTATQFDLACSGTTQLSQDEPPKPAEYRIRIDLGVMRWCWSECEQTMQIADAAPDRIVLMSERTDTPRKRSMSENSVSRTTGEHRLIWIESRPFPTYVETKGKCSPAPFSGFPAALF